MPDPHAERRERVARTLRDDRVDALLVASVANVGYLTGFTGDATTLLVMPDRAIAVSDFRYADDLAEECPDVEAMIRPIGQTMMAGVAGVVAGLGLASLGVEATSVSLADYEALTGAMPDVEVRSVSGRVEALRMVKDREEIAATRGAVAAAERAFAMLRAGLRLDETEKDATDALEAYLRRCGAVGSSFPPIVAVGPHAALPHHRGSPTTRLGEADFLLVDWGACSGPYKSDLTRMLVTGKVTPRFAEVYRTVLAAQERGIAAIRPGALARDVDAEARSVIEEAGFGRFFGHGLGHGVGREIHEAPFLRRESAVVLRPGMVVTVEPGIYLPGWGGVRIEDDVLVTPDGREVLTGVPKALDALGSFER